MKRFAAVLIVLALFACTTAAPPVYRLTPIGSSPTGEVRGIVALDSNPLPGATVTVRSRESGSHTTVTDVNGSFRIAGLLPGPYILHVQMDAMQRIAQPVTVQAGFALEANLTMRLGAFSEAITVTASTPAMITSPGTFVFDAITESAVMPGDVSSEYGRSTSAPPAGVVNAVTKSGAPPSAEPPAQPKYAHIEEHAFQQ